MYKLFSCVNGNRRKGILNLHLNIQTLNNKVSEIKNLIKEHSPNIFGLSECELRKVDGNYDETRLKIPGYDVLFPKSWTANGIARVIVYVKNNFEYEQLQDLEDDQVQSVWLRGGFKNGEKIYFCHGYSKFYKTFTLRLNNIQGVPQYFVQFSWTSLSYFIAFFKNLFSQYPIPLYKREKNSGKSPLKVPRGLRYLIFHFREEF